MAAARGALAGPARWGGGAPPSESGARPPPSTEPHAAAPLAESGGVAWRWWEGGGLDGLRPHPQQQPARRHTDASGPASESWRSGPPRHPVPSAASVRRPAAPAARPGPAATVGGAEWAWEAAAGPGPADPFRGDWPHWETRTR